VQKMKTITTALLFLIQSAFVGATSAVGFPTDRMEVSRISDHILLVEVTGLATEAEEGGGLRATTYKVSGKVLETLRGEQPKNWSYTTTDIEVTDINIAEKSLGQEFMELLQNGREFKREGSQCAAGERYLVIYWGGCAFFVHVPKADTEWRSKIRPREHERWPEDNKSYGFPEWRSDLSPRKATIAEEAQQATPRNH